MSHSITANQREVLAVLDEISHAPFYLQGVSSDGSLNVNVTSLTPSGTQDVNLTKVGGTAIALGQTTMSASVPVTIASNQSALPVSLTSTTITGTVAVTQSTSPWVISGTVTANPPSLPSTLVAFVTTITTAGTRVQLASNTLSQGVVIEAPSTNTGVIYVGGSSVSATVYGAELQPGQSTGLAVSNTNLVYVDTATNANKVAVIGG